MPQTSWSENYHLVATSLKESVKPKVFCKNKHHVHLCFDRNRPTTVQQADLLVDLLKTTTGEVPLLAEHFDEKKYCPSTVVGRLSNLKPTDDHFRRSQRLIIS